MEIVSDIKKRMDTDTVFQESQKLMNQYYIDRGLRPVVTPPKNGPAGVLMLSPRNLDHLVSDLNKIVHIPVVILEKLNLDTPARSIRTSVKTPGVN
jgi:hypothetical protein